MGGPPPGMWRPPGAPPPNSGPQPPPNIGPTRPPLFPAATSQAPPQPSLSAQAEAGQSMPTPAAFPPPGIPLPASPQVTASSSGGDGGKSSLPSGIKKVDSTGSGQIIVHPDEDISLEEKRAKLPRYTGGPSGDPNIHYSSGMIRY
ncbi:hypothetical protein EB796_004575 [Bugula neritina]|nr:hypothetical protein EB796_004575 [Bugula neritina]